MSAERNPIYKSTRFPCRRSLRSRRLGSPAGSLADGVRSAHPTSLIYTQIFGNFTSIRNFAETARKSRCLPLTRLAKQRDIFCGPAFFACGFRILSGRLYVSLYFRQRLLRIIFVYLHDYARFIFRYPTPRKRDILIFRVIRFAY